MRFGSSIVVARQVTPSQYGLGTLAIIAAAFAAVLANQGFGTPLVQRPSLDEMHQGIAATLSVGAGLAMSAVLFFAGPPVFSGIFSKEMGDLMRLISPVFVIAAFGAVPLAYLQRALDFKRLAVFESAGVGANALTSAGLALAGLNSEAIVLGAIAQQAVTCALALAVTPFFRPRFNRGKAWELLRFGIPAAGSSFVYTLFRNVDFAMVGARLGTGDVGIYTRGYNLGVDYQSKVSAVMQRVAFPVFSRAPDMATLRRMRLRIVRTHGTVLIPLLALLIGLAPDLVPAVFGAQWEPSVLPTQLLAVSGMFAATMTGTGPLLMAAGHPKVLLSWNLALLVLYGAMVYLVAPFGLTTLCIGVDVFFAALFVSNQALVWWIIGVSPWQTALDAAPGVVAGVAVCVVAIGGRQLLGDTPTVVRLAAATALGLAAGGLTLRALFPAAWRDIVLVGRRVLGRGAPPATSEDT